MERVELACHTGYSRRNGIGFGREWVRFADENNIKTLVITDSGNVDGFIDMQLARDAARSDVKLIMGADISVIDDRDAVEKANDDRDAWGKANDDRGAGENVTGNASESGRLTVLVRNETGKKNLYRILSEGERKYKGGLDEPQIPLSYLLDNREGLLIGSRGTYRFLDYIEIPFTLVTGEEIKELISLADYYNIPAVAVCEPYYYDADVHPAYCVLHGNPDCAERHYRTTDDMLRTFAFLGEEKAQEIVVTNSNKIADMCVEVAAVPGKKMYPYIENQDEILRDICEKALPEKYPAITDTIRERLEWELNAIKTTQSAFMFIQAKDVIDRMGLMPFEVGARGGVCSSIVAHLCGISEIDPIETGMRPYFFFGYNGDKEPDIDLNFSQDNQSKVMDAFEAAPGICGFVRAGAIETIGEDAAEKMLYEYGDRNKMHFSETENDVVVNALTKCVESRSIHPAGIILVPENSDILDICPVTTVKSGDKTIETSAFTWYATEYIACKFDVLCHTSQSILRKMYDLTGVRPETISTQDPDVMQMFAAEDGKTPECAGIPEFDNERIIESLKTANCKCFDDLVKLCGLMHGTCTWEENAEELLREGKADISQVVAYRDDVYDVLLGYGIDDKTSFRLAEAVRRGMVARGRSRIWEESKQLLMEKGVPDWYIGSCEKIRYLYPKAHTYLYMLNSWRTAWYKLHYPSEFSSVMIEMNTER